MKKDLRIWFAEFWGLFDYNDNLFTYILSHNYNVIVTPEDPNIVITGGVKPLNYPNAIKIYYSSESWFDIGSNDYALTSYHVPNDNRFFRLPLCLLYLYDYYKHKITDDYEILFNKQPNKDILKTKSKFCTYVSQGFGHPNCIRERFYDKLSQYKHIDAAGKHKNNHPLIQGEAGTINGSINKINFLKDYKFVMAFEGTDIDRNHGYSGWITEKIMEPMLAYSIPIYWGNSLINKDLNTKSFVNWHDFNNDEDVIKRIIEIDNNDNLYMDYINQQYILDKENSVFKKEYLIDMFEKIINKK